MRVMNKFSPVQAVALTAVLGLGILSTAGCGHDDSSQTPTTAATPAPRNSPAVLPPPPNAPAKTPASSNTPGAMPPPGNATGQ